MNNRSLIGKFKEALAWCGEKSRKQVASWAERETTRTCHACLREVAGGLDPSIRSWTCVGCEQHHIRDENSAINGLRRFLEKEKAPSLLGAVPSSGTVTIKKRWAWRVLPRGVLCTARGQDSLERSNCQETKTKVWEPSILNDQGCADFVQDGLWLEERG